MTAPLKKKIKLFADEIRGAVIMLRVTSVATVFILAVLFGIGYGVNIDHIKCRTDIPYDLTLNFLGALTVGVGGIAQFIILADSDRRAKRLHNISYSVALARAAGLYLGIGGLIVALAASVALADYKPPFPLCVCFPL